MCNPRRVTIRLNQAIREAWETTLEQIATASGEVQERAIVTADIPLATEMGDLPLEMLERLVSGEFADYQGWERDHEGNYRRDLDGVTLIYPPGSQQLLIEARLAEQVDAEARATARACGFTIGEVAVDAVGNYYSDGWGGYTEEKARQDAQAAARQKLGAAVEAYHHEVHRDEIETAKAEATRQAQERADDELRRRQAEVRQALRGRLQGILSEAEDRIHQTINRLVGQSYRRSLLHMVQQNGGRILSDQGSGSMITLELEV